MSTPQTFEQYRDQRLGPEVQGVTDLSQFEDCFNAGRASVLSSAPTAGLTVVHQRHPYRSLAEKFRRDQEWVDRYYLCQWDWSKPVRKPSARKAV